MTLEKNNDNLFKRLLRRRNSTVKRPYMERLNRFMGAVFQSPKTRPESPPARQQDPFRQANLQQRA